MHGASMNKDLIKGILMLVGLIVALTVGAFALSDNGGHKAVCVARAIGSGVSFSHLAQVCGMQ